MINMEVIKEQIKKTINHSQGIECNDDGLNSLIDNWYANKKHFIDAWGGNLTIELEQEVKMDIDYGQKESEKDGFCFLAASLADYGGHIKNFIACQDMDSFYKNRVSCAYEIEGKTINVGDKISKSFKWFFANPDKEKIDKLQTAISKLIQSCSTKGRLVMSVHPLDFLSSSENNHNWRSCHSLDGQYRAGNLSYMQDDCTFMVYLKSNEDTVLPNFPVDLKWNSKKWRMLVHHKDGLLVFSKQYPFCNDRMFKMSVDMLIKKFINIDEYGDYDKLKYNEIMSIILDNECSLHFNDCLNSLYYDCAGYIRPDIRALIEEKSYNSPMIFGHSLMCLECGDGGVAKSSDVRCGCCGEYGFCECCGAAMYEDEQYYLQGSSVCEDCFSEYGMYCDGCGEYFDESKEKMTYNEEQMVCYCTKCAERYYEEVENE